jgi:Domain of unknown function (DUF3883)
MPVVMSTAEGKEHSGYTYDDRTGVSYEYPAGRYERWIQTGERFVYHKPSVGYSGVGIIGAITPSKTAGRLVCEILDFQAFDAYVPIKDAAGDYYEADTNYWADKIYWGQGVRPLSTERFETIVGVQVAGAGGSAPKKGHGYASPDVSAAVDLYAMKAAMKEVATLFPGELVEQMPKNNPGYDIRVGPSGAEVRFVEVKGTQSSDPVFFLTEGERKFSALEKHRYTLLVITGIDLKASTEAARHRRDGEVNAGMANLEPAQWRGLLL